MHRLTSTALILALATTPCAAQSLRGSRASMHRQNRVARENNFTYLRTTSQVRQFVQAGYLVRVRPNANLGMGNVSFPYARPQVRVFLTRLADQYHAACGEQLVVTSLTRPESRQPWNASSHSVHPTGMAMDLRVSHRRACRSWLEGTLLSLEKQGILEATREHHPPHYHVALFPQRYEHYVARLTRDDDATAARLVSNDAAVVDPDTLEYRVRSGDSLWTIARQHGITVAMLKQVNKLDTSRIYEGQVLEVPTVR